MLKDITILLIGAILSLGPAATAMAAPLYFPSTPRWIWHHAFWLGIAMFVIMCGDVTLLLFVKKIRYGTLALGSVALFIMSWAIAHQFADRTESTSTPPRQNPLSMRNIFDSDFKDLAKISMARSIDAENHKESLVYSEYIDIPTNSYFLSIYFGKEISYTSFINFFTSNIDNVINDLGQIAFKLTTPGDTRVISNKDMLFSK